MADDPTYRRYDMEAPDYGDDPDRFTVELVHNGFFCGLRDNVEYISSTTDWFDNCNSDTFSVLLLEEFVKQLGHVIDARTHIYWIKPGQGLLDGLLCVQRDSHILQLTEAAKKHKTLCLIVDHTNFLNIFREDLIIKECTELPIAGRQAGSSTSAELVVVPDDEQCAESEEEGTDQEFYDSDWDAEDGDDDLFLAHVDTEVNDHNEPLEIREEEDDAGLEHEDIHLTIEQHQDL